MPNYASICLNMSEYVGIGMNMPKSARMAFEYETRNMKLFS